MLRRSAHGFTRLFFILILCSCSTRSEFNPGSDPWSADVDAVRQEVQGKASEDFVLKTLADEKVSDEEVIEVGIQMETCMKNLGYDTFSYKPIEQNFGELGNPERWNQANVERDINRCLEDSGADALVYLWGSMRTNPYNIDPNELFISCLKKLKVIDESYSAEEYQQAFEKYLAEHSDENGYVDSDPVLAVIPFLTNEHTAQESANTCRVEPQTVLYPEKKR